MTPEELQQQAIYDPDAACVGSAEYTNPLFIQTELGPLYVETTPGIVLTFDPETKKLILKPKLSEQPGNTIVETDDGLYAGLSGDSICVPSSFRGFYSSPTFGALGGPDKCAAADSLPAATYQLSNITPAGTFARFTAFVIGPFDFPVLVDLTSRLNGRLPADTVVESSFLVNGSSNTPYSQVPVTSDTGVARASAYPCDMPDSGEGCNGKCERLITLPHRTTLTLPAGVSVTVDVQINVTGSGQPFFLQERSVEYRITRTC